MQHRSFMRTLALGLATTAALTLAAAAADTAGSGVTFVNGSSHRVDVYTRYGSDAACDAKPESKRITIDAGQNGVLDSGSSSAADAVAGEEAAPAADGPRSRRAAPVT